MSKPTRRGLLLLGGAAVVGGVYWNHTHPGWFGDLAERQPRPLDNAGGCRTPEDLERFDRLADAKLGYEPGKKATSMKSDPAFLERLNVWAKDWENIAGLGAMTRVWSYGAWTDKCDSLHQLGRAFDIAEVEHANGSISCRFDSWGPGNADELRAYWRLAASLHAHFAYTLTYLYNQEHNNHIHVDNTVSGSGPTQFNQASRVQVQLVQAACKYVHGRSVEITGSWDSQTRSELRAVQKSLGITRPLADPQGWQDFLRATAAG